VGKMFAANEPDSASASSRDVPHHPFSYKKPTSCLLVAAPRRIYGLVQRANGIRFCLHRFALSQWSSPLPRSVINIHDSRTAGRPRPSTPQGSQGSYNLTIRGTKSSARALGTCNIFVNSTYNGINAYSTAYFDVLQPCDLAPPPNGDGILNSAGAAAFVTNYLKYYAGLSYDHRADMDGNGIMNSNDVTLYVNAYLTYSSWN